MAPGNPKTARSLFDAYDVDTPVVTEVRRLLQILRRQSRDAERRTYLITSAARGEGKTTTAGLLSLVSAQVFGRRTLLIDGDLRRPAVHTLLGIPQGPGLYDLLHDKVSIDDATRATPYPTYHVITSGKPTGSLGHAYDDDAFAALLTELRPRYDLIFVDSAPVVPVIEPLVMAEHVDAVLLVAMAGHTPVVMLRRMKQILAPVAEKVAGVILNNAEEGLPYYYEYRYYGYKQPTKRRHAERTAPPPEETDP